MNKTTFSDLFHALATALRTSHDKGVQFERLMKRYLTVDLQYGNRLAKIWLWSEWPDRWGPDVGIDLDGTGTWQRRLLGHSMQIL